MNVTKTALGWLQTTQEAAKTLLLFTYSDFKTLVIPVVRISVGHLFPSINEFIVFSFKGHFCVCLSASILCSTCYPWLDVDMASSSFWALLFSLLLDLHLDDQDTFTAVQHV